MNTTILYILCILVFLLYFKWIVALIIFPSEIVYLKYHRIKEETGKKNRLLQLFALPWWLMNKHTKSGWDRYFLFQVSTIPSVHLRKAIYKLLGASIGPNVVFHFKTEIRGIQRLAVGGGTVVGDNALLDARQGLTIGRNVNISSNVSIYTLQHDHRDPEFRNVKGRKASVEIDDRAWVSSNVIVLPGVHIGEGAVCCAGCVVTKDVEPYAVVAGIPAKKVNERPRNLTYEFDGRSCRFY